MSAQILRNAEVCLTLWGNAQRGGHYIGYARRNVLHRVMTEGAGASAATAPDGQEGKHDAVIDLVSGYVQLLSWDVIDVLRARYVHGDSEVSGSRRLGISRRIYSRLLRQGTWFVAGALTAVELGDAKSVATNR